jgi:putative acyl-CoA dehydrogenase
MDTVEAFFDEIGLAAGGDARLDAFVDALRADLRDFSAIETRARRLVERMALALQAALLVRADDSDVAEAFCASRLAGDHGLAFGTLPAGIDFTRIIERARPQLDAA